MIEEQTTLFWSSARNCKLERKSWPSPVLSPRFLLFERGTEDRKRRNEGRRKETREEKKKRRREGAER